VVLRRDQAERLGLTRLLGGEEIGDGAVGLLQRVDGANLARRRARPYLSLA
jgi:hypothetical protein